MRLAAKLSVAAIFIATTNAAVLAQPKPFYAGKVISLSTFTPPGGSYDTYLRLLAQHMGKHIPGAPNFVVLNQPGAGGIEALNYAGLSAPKDGTFMTLVGVGMFTNESLQGISGVSLKQFNWIGNFTSETNVILTSPTSQTKTLADAEKHSVLLGSIGAGSIDAQLPSAANYLLGTQFKVLYGYQGSSEVLLAMERGEVEGRLNGWSSLKAELGLDRLAKMNVLLQIGEKKNVDLPNTPLLNDSVTAGSEKRAVANFITQSLAMSRPLAAPPEVPPERVAILRRAFDATMSDPDFLADAKKAGYDIDPTRGEDVQSLVQEFFATPDAVVKMAKDALALQTR
jgi:tripartite-type tricarboxylate transporter receptor subunit TctC